MKAQIILLGTLCLLLVGCNQNSPTYTTGKDISVKGHCYLEREGSTFFLFSDSTVSLINGSVISPESGVAIYENVPYVQEYEVVKLWPYSTSPNQVNGKEVIISYGDFILWNNKPYAKEY